MSFSVGHVAPFGLIYDLPGKWNYFLVHFVVRDNLRGRIGILIILLTMF